MLFAQVLVVDDHREFAHFLELALRHTGYRVTIKSTAAAALQAAQVGVFDIILLDVMLPDRSGLEVCRLLRQKGIRAPVLLLSALGSAEDTVRGLESGADDYLAKPFTVQELVARIRVQLRGQRLTSGIRPGALLRAGSLLLAPKRREAWRFGQELDLTQREFDLVEYLIRHKRVTCSREEILKEIWGAQHPGHTRVIDVHILHLRGKIEEPFAGKRLIQTVRGFGYRLEPDELRDQYGD